MSLAASYRLIAPFYDLAVARVMRRARIASLGRVPPSGRLHVLIDGIGTGLDLPHLPLGHRYVGIDLVRPMLDRAKARRSGRDCVLVQGDCMRLPFADAQFDLVILHLIVAVVPDPVRALAEAARVARPGATLLVFDKFLRYGQRAPLRRLLSPIAGRVATRLDVTLEDLLAAVPCLRVSADQPALAGGWFRSVTLEKRTP